MSEASPPTAAPAAAPALTLLVCETCRRDGRPAGEHLAATLRRRLEDGAAPAGMRLDTFRCLMACSRACAVQIRTPGRMAYTIGDLDPERPEAVDGLLAWLHAYRASPSGVVPYAQWPEAVKGHFVTRMPPLDGE